MKLVNKSKLMQAAVVLTSAFLLATTAATAQDYAQQYEQPPSFAPDQVDQLVSRIALYPDPLLAQIFAAASFPDQVAEAARWAEQYRGLRGDQLANAIHEANLRFDPAVQALIPFPSVLEMMAGDLNWTSELGNAVLADRPLVMDAVQRMRRSAEQYGYLQSNQQIRVVDSGDAVEIEPATPSLIYVPVYDPYVVYAPPRPGFFIGGAIGFGSCYSVGAFGDWGWGGGFNWYNHVVFVNHAPWGRTWDNRNVYVHNYGNWDRGGWRNQERTHYRVENVNRYNDMNRSNNGNRYDNGNRYSDVNRNSYNTFANNSPRGGQSSAVVPSRTYNSYAATPSRNYERAPYAERGASRVQSAPVVRQSQSFAAPRGNSGGGHFDRSFSGRR